MFSETLKRIVEIMGPSHASSYFGALIFLKWLFKKRPGFVKMLGLEQFSILSSARNGNLDVDLQDIFARIERFESNEYAGLFSWINFSDLRPAYSGSRLHYIGEIVSAVEESDLDEPAMLAQVLLFVESTSVETPTSIAELISALVACRAGEKILDPVSGSASLILSCADQAAKITALERNRSMWFFAKLNTMMSGHSSTHVYNADCFSDVPGVPDKFDVVIGNPPWGIRLDSWHGAIRAFDELPFKPTAKSLLDYAFVLEMIRRMDPVRGRVAVLVSNGMLTRSGFEEQIRRSLIEQNLLDAVIALPEKMFANTAIGASILLFKASRISNDILFLDARPHATQSRGQNSFSNDAVDTIASIVQSPESSDGPFRLVSISEVAEQNFTISVPRYVNTAPSSEHLSIESMLERKATLKVEVDQLSDRIDVLVNELRSRMLL